MMTKAHVWQDNSSATLKQVAKAVGVSESLASVVLNGAKSGTRVSALTRAKVIEAARSMGYRPNSVARSLLTGKTHRLGLYSEHLLLWPGSLFSTEVLCGLFDGAAAHEMDLLIHVSERDAQVNRAVEMLTNRSIDGLIVHAKADDPVLPLLGEVRVPAIAIVDRIDDIPSICADDRSGGAIAAQYLHRACHRHVLARRAYTRSGVDRVDAFCEAAALLGIKVTVTEPSYCGIQPAELEILKGSQDRATAMFVWNDLDAIKVCKDLIAAGVEIPRDVAVLGFDGYDIEFGQGLRLTTIQAHWRAVSRSAVNFLMALIHGDPIPNLTLVPIEFRRGNTA